MASPARAGVVIYALDLDKLSDFYVSLLGAQVLHADAAYQALQTQDAQLILHAIGPLHRESIAIQTPPEPRESQAIKPFFTVPSLAEAERMAVDRGGLVLGPVWPSQGMKLRSVCDPEGNIIQLREPSA